MKLSELHEKLKGSAWNITLNFKEDFISILVMPNINNKKNVKPLFVKRPVEEIDQAMDEVMKKVVEVAPSAITIFQMEDSLDAKKKEIATPKKSVKKKDEPVKEVKTEEMKFF